MAEAPTPAPHPAARRRFGPLLVAGLAGGGLAAVAGNQDWAVLDDGPGSASTEIASTAVASSLSEGAPLVTALGLVVLACWGVLLVSRGRFRRAVAGLGALAAAGVLAAAVTAWLDAPSRLTEALAAYGAVDVGAGRTAWSAVGVVAGVLALVAAALAVRDVRWWPEMGSRYDAPSAVPRPHHRPAETEETTNLDLWRAMDEGEDPTR